MKKGKAVLLSIVDVEKILSNVLKATYHLSFEDGRYYATGIDDEFLEVDDVDCILSDYFGQKGEGYILDNYNCNKKEDIVFFMQESTYE